MYVEIMSVGPCKFLFASDHFGQIDEFGLVASSPLELYRLRTLFVFPAVLVQIQD